MGKQIFKISIILGLFFSVVLLFLLVTNPIALAEGPPEAHWGVVLTSTSVEGDPMSRTPITFKSFSHDPDYGDPEGGGCCIVSTHWNFGDGSEAWGVEVTHTYENGGYYTFTLTVIDDEGHQASISHLFWVQPQPGNLEIIKETDGGDGIFTFTIYIPDQNNPVEYPSISTIGGSGTYTLTDTVTSYYEGYTIFEWDPLSGSFFYDSSQCFLQDGSPTGSLGILGIIGVEIQEEETTTCIFRNVGIGSLKIIKETVGGDDNFEFEVTGMGEFYQGNINTYNSQGELTFDRLLNGEYNVGETWHHESYYLDIAECWLEDGTPTGALAGENIQNVRINTGETTTCIFKNKMRKGDLKIIKRTKGGDGTFNFAIHEPAPYGGPDPIIKAISTVNGWSETLISDTWEGNYIIYEYDMSEDFAFYDAECHLQNGESTGTLLDKSVYNVEVKPSETTTCVFINQPPCPTKDLIPIKPDALPFEESAPKTLPSSLIPPKVDPYLHSAMADLSDYIYGLTNKTIVRRSGYRPKGYQEHFRELRDKWVEITNFNNKNPDKITYCEKLLKKIDYEIDIKHHIIRGAGRIPSVNEPDSSCHTLDPAKGLDISRFSYPADFNIENAARIFDLNMRYSKTGDRVHFELEGTSCYSGKNSPISIIMDSDPIDILVRDPLGRVIGFDPVENKVVNEIGEEAYYNGPNNSIQLIDINDPVPGSYSITGVGIEGENYTLEIIRFNDHSDILETVISKGFVLPGDEIEPLTFMASTVMTVKSSALEDLESLKSGDKKTDKKIDKAIKHIEKSLENKLWTDENHLDPKHGKKVFNEEEKAVKELKKLCKKNSEICPYDDIINKLVQADEILATNVIDDAKATPVLDPKKQEKVDKEISKAEKELTNDKEDDEVHEESPEKAIKRFKKAWEHAQQAIKHAQKTEEKEEKEKHEDDDR